MATVVLAYVSTLPFIVNSQSTCTSYDNITETCYIERTTKWLPSELIQSLFTLHHLQMNRRNLFSNTVQTSRVIPYTQTASSRVPEIDIPADPIIPQTLRPDHSYCVHHHLRVNHVRSIVILTEPVKDPQSIRETVILFISTSML